jgi:hypothetical protein
MSNNSFGLGFCQQAFTTVSSAGPILYNPSRESRFSGLSQSIDSIATNGDNLGQYSRFGDSLTVDERGAVVFAKPDEVNEQLEASTYSELPPVQSTSGGVQIDEKGSVVFTKPDEANKPTGSGTFAIPETNRGKMSTAGKIGIGVLATFAFWAVYRLFTDSTEQK